MLKCLQMIALCTVTGPALAGGWSGSAGSAGSYPLCSELAARGGHVASGQACIDANGALVTGGQGVGYLQTEVLEVRRGGILCAYPYRASDSVFINGSGYVFKDTLRAQSGCL